MMNFSPNESLAAGRMLGGKYKIVRELGRGGFGTVFEALNETLKKQVAIKVLNANVISDATTRERFKLEMEAGAKLAHPNLIAVIDSGFTETGEPFLVMEYVAGHGLDALLIRRPRPQLSELVPVLIQIGKALNYLHSSNIIHRDLKPSNILVTEIAGETYAKLLDLGIAKVISDGANPTTNLTATGTIFGTIAYMSPEQCQGLPIDTRSDIYSFGCILYECISGRMPFYGDNPLQILLKHINEAPPALPCRTDMERGMSEIALRCLQKNPRDRFQKIEQVTSALQQVASGTSPTGSNLSRSYSSVSAPGTEQRQAATSSGIMIGGLVGLAIVAAVGLGALWTMQQHKPEPQPEHTPPPAVQATVAAPQPQATPVDVEAESLKLQLEAERQKNAEAQRKLAAALATPKKAKAAIATNAVIPAVPEATPRAIPKLQPAVQEFAYNGNFEAGPGDGGWVPCTRGDTRIAGWMVTKGAVDYFHTDRALSGDRAVDLNAQDPGEISQMVRTTPGKKYNLKFCISDHPFGGPVKQWYAYAGNVGQGWSWDFRGDRGYRSVTVPFKATAAVTKITIGSKTEGGSGPLLDDVSVTLAN